jgi:hypothetical protein
MQKNYEFVPDEESPAYGKSTYALKIAPQDRDGNGRKVLVKYRRASEWGHHEVIEPGSVDGLQGVRTLRLWTACGPDFECLPVSEAKQRGKLSSIFLASALESGRLVVSSCIGYDRSRNVSLPEELWGPYNSEPIADDALIYDFKLTTQLGDINPLVPKHIKRLEHHGIDPQQQAIPDEVDLPLATLLECVPESLY